MYRNLFRSSTFLFGLLSLQKSKQFLVMYGPSSSYPIVCSNDACPRPKLPGSSSYRDRRALCVRPPPSRACRISGVGIGSDLVLTPRPTCRTRAARCCDLKTRLTSAIGDSRSDDTTQPPFLSQAKFNIMHLTSRSTMEPPISPA